MNPVYFFVLFNLRKSSQRCIKLLIIGHVLSGLCLKELFLFPLELEQRRPLSPQRRLTKSDKLKNLIERNIHYWMGHQSSQEKAIKESMDSAPCRKRLREVLTNESTERTLFITQTNWHLWICSLKKRKRNLLNAIDRSSLRGSEMGDAVAFKALKGAIDMMRVLQSRT